MDEILSIARALADPNRLRIVAALVGRELCVCQLTALLGLAVSTTSRHLSILSGARLVEMRRKGRWVYYRLASRSAPSPRCTALRWVCQALQNDRRIEQDRSLLRSILQANPEELCRNRNRK